MQIGPGDEIEYEIVDGQVILTKAWVDSKTADPFRSFDEWSTEAVDASKIGSIGPSQLKAVKGLIIQELD